MKSARRLAWGGRLATEGGPGVADDRSVAAAAGPAGTSGGILTRCLCASLTAAAAIPPVVAIATVQGPVEARAAAGCDPRQGTRASSISCDTPGDPSGDTPGNTGAGELSAGDGPAHEVRTCRGESFALTAPEHRSLEIHNRAREEAGLGHLCVNPTLTEAARGHASDMLERDYFSHDSPEGVEPVDRMMDAGYSGFEASGENIAFAAGALGEPGPIFSGLMRSPGHRENVLRPTFLEVGIGAARSADGRVGMYVMDFGVRPGQPHDHPEPEEGPGDEVPGSACADGR